MLTGGDVRSDLSILLPFDLGCPFAAIWPLSLLKEAALSMRKVTLVDAQRDSGPVDGAGEFAVMMPSQARVAGPGSAKRRLRIGGRRASPANR